MTMDENKLEFPIEFDTCPCCGSKRRIALEVVEEQKAMGKMRPEAKSALGQYISTVADPSRIIGNLTAPCITAYVDACADCGTIYVVKADRFDQELTVKNMPPGGISPPGFFGSS